MSIDLSNFSLEGRWALVTGASRGLGAGMAEALARAGANLVLVARSDLSTTEERVKAQGREVVCFQADLSQRAETKGLLKKLDEVTGYPEILVNNAGTIRRNSILEFPEEDWDEVLEINLSSIFLLSQGLAKRWVDKGLKGRIINIASMLSFQGGIKVASYTSTKTGLMGLTRLLANELAPHGICVNAIAPGYMATDNTKPLRDDPQRSQEILGRIPVGRWGDPADLGGAVVYLASPASQYVTGITLPVDGGWLAR